ncbi:MAG: polysaccharide pyruvyl transferase family protein [Planctomycetota bacterium]
MRRPIVLLLVDQPGWAYDRAAQAMQRELAGCFDVEIRYVADAPDLGRERFELLHVFFWGERYQESFTIPKERIVREISSHRFGEASFGRLNPSEMAERYLGHSALWTCTSRRLERLFSPYGKLQWTPNGFDPEHFHASGRRARGPVRIGWAGSARDPCKGLDEVLRPAAGSDFELVLADGLLPPERMGEFYRSIDVFCVASTAEGEPLTLIEAMASGCYPVCVDAGIVPELVQNREHGRIVQRDAHAFRAAFQWASLNPELVRRGGLANARRLHATRTWAHVAPFWQLAWTRALGDSRVPPASAESPISVAYPDNLERNLGQELGEWPDRAQAASRVIHELPRNEGGCLVDLGCGKQTIRPLLPAGLQYLPVDRLTRSEDTLVLDLDRELPAGRFEVGLALGLLEYCEDPGEILAWLAGHCRFAVLSFNDCSDEPRRRRQHWRCGWSPDRFASRLESLDATVLQEIELSAGERLYALEFPSIIGVEIPRTPERVERTKRIALFSAALNGDNSGDALIEDAIRRLLADCEFERLPLVYSPSEEEIERANACELGILCGTNLYQSVFASGLSGRVLDRLEIPLLPLGIGGSAALGEPIRMRAEDQVLVRRIHECCPVASVRDPASLDFLRSIGVDNAVLTGCPVLFHALEEPQFSRNPDGPLHVSVRARLLHIAGEYGARQLETLVRLVQAWSPTLVLQSPYDFPIALALARRFGCEVRLDPGFQHQALVAAAKDCGASLGFRLHYGMLCLSYGKPARFIGSDTRTESFCEMMGLPHQDIRSYRDENLLACAFLPPPERFARRWVELAANLVSVLERNGLGCGLAPLGKTHREACPA